MTYNQMIVTLCDVMGRKRAKLHAPVPLVRTVAWLSEKLMPKPLLTTDQIRMLLADNSCDITRVRRDLGIDPMPLRDGLREVVRTA
jgi:NADH dehydrogenase